MIDHCANPQCKEPLHYLRDGRIFVFETNSARAGADGKRVRRTEHYWLCEKCAQSMLLEYSPDRGISVRQKGASFSSDALAS